MSLTTKQDSVELSTESQQKRAMTSIQLITFNGCPNADKFRNILSHVGINFEDVVQDKLEENHPLKRYSSPTILIDNRVLVGSQSNGGGCSVINVSIEELEKKIKEVINGNF
jgi:glutaredoxin